jgi:hypothetical protein
MRANKKSKNSGKNDQEWGEHRVGRRWMFKQDEIDGWVRSGCASDKIPKSDTEQ